MRAAKPEAATERGPRASLDQLARAWIVIATQSVGGGPSTLYMIRQVLVRRHRWLSDRELLEDWVLAKLSVGTGFIAMTGLIGRRIAGGRGVAVSVAALILPSAAITLLLTIAYGAARDERWLIAAFSGAGPVTAGMIVGISYAFGRQSLRRGRAGLIDRAYWVIALLAAIFLQASPVVLIPLGLVVGMSLMRGESARASGDPPT